jgi:hypothetical protein
MPSEQATRRFARSVMFFFMCDEARDIHAELRERALALGSPEVMFYGMRQVMVQDPDRYDLCFESAIEPAPEEQGTS